MQSAAQPLGQPPFRVGHIAIVGRPNVGKSTLFNHLVGQKLSITSRKAQTTRHRVAGILNRERAQFVFVDTPGFQTRHLNALNSALNRSVKQALREVNIVLLVIEAGQLGARDREVIRLLPAARPVLAVINKIDRLEDQALLLPLMEKLAVEFAFTAIVPVSAKQGKGMAELTAAIAGHLPEQEPLYPDDQVTDRDERFFAAESIREKLFRSLGEELPYACSVAIDQFVEDGGLRRIHATIFVDKPGQKAIVIGERGEKLKEIATAARLDMERLFGGKVFLKVWVKVKSGWADDSRALTRFGYDP